MNNNFDSLIDLLKTDERYVAEDGDLLKAKVYQDAMMMEESLLNLLLSQEKTKEAFFTEVGETLVFDKYEFAWLINSKEFLPDSYTAYTNKIGLATNRKFISQADDIVLDFPYKDAVLAGGQDKEDQKRDEIMFHSILAREQIMNMLTPKVFTNAKRYTAVGGEDLEGKLIPETIKVKKELATEFKEGDNLIIKGNNLIALSSLLERYEGKIKLIYIDPPFNTGSDSFKYNDKFNRSTWLTFMKNRLEVARRLLDMDGNIFIHIDNNEYHYLKVLMDEIFGEENYVQDIVWAYGSASGGRSGSAKPVNIHDFILNYAKSYSERKAFKQYTPYSEKYIEDWFKYEDEDGRKYQKRQRGRDENGESIWSKQYLDESKGVPLTTVWTDIKQVYANPQAYKEENRATSEIELDFGNSGQKPEALLKRILEMTTEEGDLVLDFFMGSGTTLSTSLKLNRRFIGVEQMGLQINIAVHRLCDAIDGKQSGISKDVNWQGGGSFVYCELKEDGQTRIDAIQASDENTISEIKDSIYQDERIVPYLTAKELEEVDNEFEQLDINNKKRVLIELVDKNKLYVNYSSIDDEDYDVSDEDKSFTHSFYEVAK